MSTTVDGVERAQLVRRSDPGKGTTVVVPAVRQAGWSVERVLTDGGGEFKAEFAAACAALGIRHTRIKPRHAWTNGFVERLRVE